MAWASALAWTPVLSPHLAIYDTVLLIPAVFLAAAARGLSSRLLWLIIIVYVTAWFSQGVSAIAGFQPLSFAIVLLGWHLSLSGTRSR